VIVYLKLKGFCGRCGRYARVDFHWLCRSCHRKDLFRDVVLLFLLGVLAAVVGVVLGLVILFR
jgi:hypothetical protein